MADSRYKDVSRLLEAFFDRETLKAGGRYVEFLRSWGKIAGEQLASHSKPLDVKNGMLLVGAEHSSWIQLLQMKQETIISRVRAGFPELEVKSIAFRLVDDVARAETASAGTSKAAGSAADTPPPEESATSLKGSATEEALPEALRDVFGRLKKKLEP